MIPEWMLLMDMSPEQRAEYEQESLSRLKRPQDRNTPRKARVT